MQQFLPRYMTRMTGSMMLAILLLFSVSGLEAQTTYDTLVLKEEEVQDPPPAVTEEYVDEEDDRKEERFLPLNERDSFEVRERRLRAGYADDLKKDADFWYADAKVKKKEKKEKQEMQYDADYTPFMKRAWVQTLLWIIIVGGFAFAVLWYLVDSNVGLFRKKNVATVGNEAADEEMPEDIFAINYQKEIDKAIAQGNYRLGVRIQFLRMLKNLADKNIIQYKQGKTNLDYLMELSPKSYYPSFFRLTRHFEYSWYGHFEVGEDAYHKIATEFNQFEKQVQD